MYCSFEKPLREENKLRKHPKNPSFSSILLDEIFNSIDGNEQKSNETKQYKNQYSRKPNNGVEYVKMKATSNCKEGDEQMASMKRASLVEKLMEKKVNGKLCSIKNVSYLQEFDNLRSLHDSNDPIQGQGSRGVGSMTVSQFYDNNDPRFFSTSSSSSSESSSGALSSSEAEIFYNSISRKSSIVTSCFSTKASSKSNKSTPKFPPRPMRNNHQDSSNNKQSECYIFDDFYNTTHQINGYEHEDNFVKSKSRAMKIYNNLKKVKQPISPGGRLTNFITSLFASGNVKKSKEVVKPSSTNASTCSSASSFSRSCMSKSAPTSRGKFDDYGVKKTVHFYPVSVIVDEDARPCGHKSINDQEFDRFKCQTRSYQSLATLQTHVLERNKNIDQEVARNVLINKGFKGNQEKNGDYANDDDYEDDYDGVSDCSSDLFEIDHLEVFGNTRFCEELPVYETTHLDRNRAIARGLKG